MDSSFGRKILSLDNRTVFRFWLFFYVFISLNIWSPKEPKWAKTPSPWYFPLHIGPQPDRSLLKTHLPVNAFLILICKYLSFLYLIKVNFVSYDPLKENTLHTDELDRNERVLPEIIRRYHQLLFKKDTTVKWLVFNAPWNIPYLIQEFGRVSTSVISKISSFALRFASSFPVTTHKPWERPRQRRGGDTPLMSRRKVGLRKNRCTPRSFWTYAKRRI